MNCVAQTNVKMKDSFFLKLMSIAANGIIPYQWEALNDRVPDAAPSYCIRNFKSAAGMVKEPFDGCVFQDSDLAKWLEACSYMLMWRDDPETEKNMDEVIDIVARAQRDDGYLDTYYILNGLDKRWTNVRDNHELYCAGHMLEAAVAYYKAKGKRKLLDVMIKYVDHIDSVFGPEEGKLHGYPGHEEIELALVKLYEVTKDKKHLNLAKYFIDERGKDNGSFFADEAVRRGEKPGSWDRSVYSEYRYHQAGSPVREQKVALGHAVRQCYLLSGIADVARETGDVELMDVCRAMFRDITRRQMYITGAVGQSSFGEAFTFGYDLPNDTVYGETCASIAMVFFAQRMLRMEPRGEYGDVLDTMIYNGTISGMNLEGNRFFYVNPLEVWPERSEKSMTVHHAVSERRKWFGCACCPPNLARMISSLPGYVFLSDKNRVYTDLFTACQAEFELDGGKAAVEVSTQYPWNGRVEIKITEAFEGFELAVRKPGWCRKYTLSHEGTENDGFITVKGLKAGDTVVYEMDMPAVIVRANPLVRADAGRVALRKGPVVYCLEEIDNGANISAIRLVRGATPESSFEADLLGGVNVVTMAAKRINEWNSDELYADVQEETTDITARFVPYYAWNNRGKGEMSVWVRME